MKIQEPERQAALFAPFAGEPWRFPASRLFPFHVCNDMPLEFTLLECSEITGMAPLASQSAMDVADVGGQGTTGAIFEPTFKTRITHSTMNNVNVLKQVLFKVTFVSTFIALVLDAFVYGSIMCIQSIK